jgi:hypothetical protein
VPIKGFDSCQEFFVVSERNQYLRMISYGLLQHRQRPLRYFMLLELPDLSFIKLRLWNVDILTGKGEGSVTRNPSSRKDIIPHVVRIRQRISVCPVLSRSSSRSSFESTRVESYLPSIRTVAKPKLSLDYLHKHGSTESQGKGRRSQELRY